MPVIYKNLIVTGAGTPDAAPNVGAKGDTRAWDARPASWSGPSIPFRVPAKFGMTPGAATAPATLRRQCLEHFTVDEKRGISICRSARPTFDRCGGDRQGANLFGYSLVAVDANTGKYLWHFQVTHHDIWDYDTQDPPVLMDVNKDGKTFPPC